MLPWLRRGGARLLAAPPGRLNEGAGPTVRTCQSHPSG